MQKYVEARRFENALGQAVKTQISGVDVMITMVQRQLVRRQVVRRQLVQYYKSDNSSANKSSADISSALQLVQYQLVRPTSRPVL
jgi:hypothetical protein